MWWDINFMEINGMKNYVITYVKDRWLEGDRSMVLKVAVDKNTIRKW